MIRPLLPTDLILLIFQGNSFSNQSKTRHYLSRKETKLSTLSTLLGGWIIPRVRHTQVLAKGSNLVGLASARNRSSPQAWEIDILMLDEQDKGCCLSLLERLSSAARGTKTEKLFLRLADESPLLDAAISTGFSHYSTDCLYCLRREEAEKVDSPFFLRYKQSSDEYRLFRLYQACVPPAVQRVEGITFGEWQKVRDRTVGQEKEWIYEKDGNLLGWLRVGTIGDVGQFEMMAPPEGELEQMVEHSLMLLNHCRYLFCLTPEFQPGLKQALHNRGFDQVARYSVLAKEMTVRVEQPCLMPVHA